MIDEKYLSEIKQFNNGDWIVWVGTPRRHPGWNRYGYRDFIFDGKPHKVNEGVGTSASFFDSPKKNNMWDWRGNTHNMRKVNVKAILKDLME